MDQQLSTDTLFRKEYWLGNSRDGVIKNGEGYHFFKMTADGTIVEAFEVYEQDDGEPVVSPLPEMVQVNWLADLGFEDWEVLEDISEHEYAEMVSGRQAA